MHMNEIIMTKVANDATVAIIIIFFLSSDGFRLIRVFDSLVLVAVGEIFSLNLPVADTGVDTVSVAVVVLTVFTVLVVDGLAVCVFFTNLFIGS